MGQMGFYYLQDRCIGCAGCAVACKDKNNLSVGENWRRVYNVEEGAFPAVSSYYISMACNHCDDPKCVANCPTGALQKRAEDGIVVLDEERCIGCRYCVWSCPYGAPQFNEAKGKVTKCDMCVDLQEKGESPACVAACIMRALDFGEIEELRQKYGDLAYVEGMPGPELTGPNIVIRPHRAAQPRIAAKKGA